ncbi:MAG: hypothetical protein EXR91_00460 [Gemmatimonadetes bacterium]|nr:hypothetical protein [Gemmatimonadota bacterium]
MKRRILAIALLFLASACGGDAQGPVPADVMDRETFIETYVDLRVAAVAATDFRVSADERAEILARHGVDGEGLLRFADAHGRDLDYMNEIWAEVEVRIQDRTGNEAGR